MKKGQTMLKPSCESDEPSVSTTSVLGSPISPAGGMMCGNFLVKDPAIAVPT